MILIEIFSFFIGKICETDIDECQSSPCHEGSTCIDGTATFRCVCQRGMSGQFCEIDIDDCQSLPCKNGGICKDRLDNYTCICDDTGYFGQQCEFNIDDCLSNPCTNGAQCIDEVKDYSCNCYPGYEGKNCQIDINECESLPCKHEGTCLQKSNVTLYDPSNYALPSIFSQPFNFANASGYVCICAPGIEGKDCEININECESNPCGPEGTCSDEINRYVCVCNEGYEGKHCEIDIDECEKYKPCVHGICRDGRADYFCDCVKEGDKYYGGKNCSVELKGCSSSPCLNEGTCSPYLVNEDQHKFNCSCPNGYHGETCEKVTTMSMSGSSYIVVNTTRDEGYDIQFRFKTTLDDGLLAIGTGGTFYILELVHGRLNLRSSLLNKWDGVFIGSDLNDSLWQKVRFFLSF